MGPVSDRMAPPSRQPASNEAVVAAYDRLATLYDWFVAPTESGTRRRALDRLEIDADDRVLELGCGPGHALVAIARRLDGSGRVVGVDAAPRMVDRASDRASRTRWADRIEVAVGDARRLPVADDAVDVVFVEDTFELFSPAEAAAVVGECGRVLDAGGRLGVVTMERAGAERDPFIRAYEWVFEHVPGYDRLGCRPVYARRAIEAGGFIVEHEERRRRYGVWPVEILIARPD